MNFMKILIFIILLLGTSMWIAIQAGHWVDTKSVERQSRIENLEDLR